MYTKSKKCVKQGGCMWNGAACVSGQAVPCVLNTKARTCTKDPAGCSWNGTSCALAGTGGPTNCGAILDKKSCGLVMGCAWDRKAGTCNDANATPSPVAPGVIGLCSSHMDKAACKAA